MVSEEHFRRTLRAAASQAFGEQRAAQLESKLEEVARWLRIANDEPLDLLDEEPDANGR